MIILLIAEDSFMIEKIDAVFSQTDAKIFKFNSLTPAENVLTSINPDTIIINSRDFFPEDIESFLKESKKIDCPSTIILENTDEKTSDTNFTVDIDNLHATDKILEYSGFYSNQNKILFSHPVSGRLLTGIIEEITGNLYTVSSENDYEASTIPANIKINNCTFYKNNVIINKSATVVENSNKIVLEMD